MVVLDSYIAIYSVCNIIFTVHWGFVSAQGQSWNQGLFAKARVTSIVVKAHKVGNPTGTLRCRIASHTGVYGVSSKPGVDLEDSTNSVNIAGISSLSARPSTLTFTFAGTQEIDLGVNYTFYVYASAGVLSGTKYVCIHGCAISHDGNRFETTAIVGVWAAFIGNDNYFIVNGEEVLALAKSVGDGLTWLVMKKQA